MVSQKVDFCRFEEHSNEKSLNYPREFSLRLRWTKRLFSHYLQNRHN